MKNKLNYTRILRATLKVALVGMIVSILIGMIGGCASTPFSEPIKKPRIVAHRGGAGLAPENTLAAFANSLQLGVEEVELDVHLSKDGIPVVIHDPTVARTTQGSGVVVDLSLNELQTLNAAARYFGTGLYPPQKIPTLEEVLQLLQGKATVQVEIKVQANGSRYEGIEEAVIQVLRKYRMIQQAIILSFDFPTLVRIKELEPKLKTCALIGRGYLSRIGARGPETVAEEIVALGAEYVGVDERRYNPSLKEALQNRGLKVGVWTVNDPFRMQYFIQQGVEFITTDRPDLLIPLIKP